MKSKLPLIVTIALFVIMYGVGSISFPGFLLYRLSIIC